MDYFFNKYKYNIALVVGGCIALSWGQKDLLAWQMITVILAILSIFLVRVLLDRVIVDMQIREIRKWCQANHWTDLFIQDKQFYAFPPNAVIPLPIVLDEIRQLKKPSGIRHQRTIQQALTTFISVVILGSLFCVVIEIVIALSFLILKTVLIHS
jgi:hypothetical protein